MQIIDCVQGTQEWIDARLGMITASNFSKVRAKGQGATRTKYLYQLAGERLTGQPADTFTNAAMEWGTSNEPAARAMYELIMDVSVVQVGFVAMDEWVGASPDGLIGSGLLEIKCPNTATHIDTVLNGKVPPEHMPQIQGQMLVTGAEWCDFVSFDPRIKSESAFFCVRVPRDDDYIKTLMDELGAFVKDMKGVLQAMDQNYLEEIAA